MLKVILKSNIGHSDNNKNKFFVIETIVESESDSCESIFDKFQNKTHSNYQLYFYAESGIQLTTSR